MDPLPSLAYGIGTILVALVVSIVVGKRRGVDRVDGEIDRLVAAQGARLVFQDGEIARLSAALVSVTERLRLVEADLALEKKITARLRNDAT